MNGLFVYIDAENLNRSVQTVGYQRVNYVKLYNWLKTKKGARRIYLYAAHTIGDQEEAEMYNQLKRLGYVMRLKEVKVYPPKEIVTTVKCGKCGQKTKHTYTSAGRRKANCDSELTLDFINDGVRKKYSEAIIFSCDGDFSEMYKYAVEQLKKKISIYAPMAWPAKLRTSVKIKTLHNSGIITLNALEPLLPYYAEK